MAEVKKDEPQFVAVKKSDPQLIKCIESARESLDFFFETYEKHKTTLGVYFAIKVPIVDGDFTAHIWYTYTGMEGDLLLGKSFELPEELADRTNIKVTVDEVEDWMINDHGHLYGGFTIRYIRSKMSPEEQKDYDEYSGVKVYKIIDYKNRIDKTPDEQD